jgi:hypothetical protein
MVYAYLWGSADKLNWERSFAFFEIDPHQQAGCVKRGEVFAHVFEIGHQTKLLSSSAYQRVIERRTN